MLSRRRVTAAGLLCLVLPLPEWGLSCTVEVLSWSADMFPERSSKLIGFLLLDWAHGILHMLVMGSVLRLLKSDAMQDGTELFQSMLHKYSNIRYIMQRRPSAKQVADTSLL